MDGWTDRPLVWLVISPESVSDQHKRKNKFHPTILVILSSRQATRPKTKGQFSSCSQSEHTQAPTETQTQNQTQSRRASGRAPASCVHRACSGKAIRATPRHLPRRRNKDTQITRPIPRLARSVFRLLFTLFTLASDSRSSRSSSSRTIALSLLRATNRQTLRPFPLMLFLASPLSRLVLQPLRHPDRTISIKALRITPSKDRQCRNSKRRSRSMDRE